MIFYKLSTIIILSKSIFYLFLFLSKFFTLTNL